MGSDLQIAGASPTKELQVQVSGPEAVRTPQGGRKAGS